MTPEHHAEAILRAATPAVFIYERKPDAWPTYSKPVLSATAWPHDDPARPFWTEQPLYTAEAILSAVREAMGQVQQPIATAPQTGVVIHVWGPDYKWPETVKWVKYDDDLAQELGEDGYWTYAEELLADVTDSPSSEEWTHWQPLPTPPRGEALTELIAITADQYGDTER